MSKMNRKYKDTVFCDLFYRDRDAKINDLSLYNALHDTDITNPEEVTLMRLENTMFMDFYNDVAFSVRNQRIILSEHQSTINYNVPLRDLLYIAREYEQFFPTSVRYKRKAVKIPTPEFITFYNGTDDFPLETIMRLSDSFIENDDNSMLELKVRVININLDKNHEILKKCEVLRGYSCLVEETRKYGNDKEALEKAVMNCMDRGILSEYLSRKGKEAVNMLIAEYNYDEDIRVQRAEAVEELEEELIKTKQEADAAKQEADTAKQEADMAKRDADSEKSARFRMVKKLHERGNSVDEIVEISGFTADQIREILKNNDLQRSD